MPMMPPIGDYALMARNPRRMAAEQRTAWGQACRQRWQGLTLMIRVKLEAVERA